MNHLIDISLGLTTDKSALINHFPITMMNYLSNIMQLMVITLFRHVLIYTMLRGKKITNYSTVSMLHDLYQSSLDTKCKFFSSKCTFLFLHFMSVLINASLRSSLGIVVPLMSHSVFLLTALLLFALRELKIIISWQGSLSSESSSHWFVSSCAFSPSGSSARFKAPEPQFTRTSAAASSLQN